MMKTWDRKWHATIQDAWNDLVQMRSTYLADACRRYDVSAPALARWLDELSARLDGHGERQVTVEELQFAISLRDAETLSWKDPHSVQNLFYKLIERLGGDTTGMLDF